MVVVLGEVQQVLDHRVLEVVHQQINKILSGLIAVEVAVEWALRVFHL